MSNNGALRPSSTDERGHGSSPVALSEPTQLDNPKDLSATLWWPSDASVVASIRLSSLAPSRYVSLPDLFKLSCTDSWRKTEPQNSTSVQLDLLSVVGFSSAVVGNVHGPCTIASRFDTVPRRIFACRRRPVPFAHGPPGWVDSVQVRSGQIY